jgi:hypothetical protein
VSHPLLSVLHLARCLSPGAPARRELLKWPCDLPVSCACPGASRWFVEVCLCMALSCKALLLNKKKKKRTYMQSPTHGWVDIVRMYQLSGPFEGFSTRHTEVQRCTSNHKYSWCTGVGISCIPATTDAETPLDCLPKHVEFAQSTVTSTPPFVKTHSSVYVPEVHHHCPKEATLVSRPTRWHLSCSRSRCLSCVGC